MKYGEREQRIIDCERKKSILYHFCMHHDCCSPSFVVSFSFFLLHSSLRHRHHHHCNFILSCLLMISIFCLQLLSIKHTKYYILLVVTFHQQNCISHIIIILHKRCLVLLLLDTFPCNSFISFNQWYKRNERIMLFVDKVWHFVQPY